MVLAAEDKNLIAQSGLGLGQAAVAATLPTAVEAFLGGAVATGAGGSASAGLVGLAFSSLPLLAFLPPAIGLASLFGRQEFPRGPTGREIFDPANRLRAQGLDPRFSRDPFFGDLVISTFDQDPFLDELVRSSAVRRVAARQDFSDVLAIREGVIEGLAETAQERGFSRTIDPSFRGGVFRETADSPLQVVER